MSADIHRIASHIFNAPLLLRPETAVAIASGLAARTGIMPMDGADDPAVIEASRFRGRPAGPAASKGEMYRIEQGVATIAVHGELVNRGAWIGASSGLTSYEGLEAQLRAAAADPAVTGIVLDMNSPGGEASGCMEIGALVRRISVDKPVAAFVNGLAASAGYAIAAGAPTIVTIATGGLGSIGAVMLHLDRSGALAKAGVKPTLIHAGAHKVDGSSLAALPADARARIQASIDDVYDLFVRHVAGLRPLSVAAVRATEGSVYMGAKAVAAGLADRVGTFDDAIAAASRPNSPYSPPPPPAFSITGSSYGALGIAAGAARSRAILEHPQAAGRHDMAMHLAFATDFTVAQAADLLAAAPHAASTSALPRAPRRPIAIIDPKLSPGAPELDYSNDAGASWAPLVDRLNAEHFGNAPGR